MAHSRVPLDAGSSGTKGAIPPVFAGVLLLMVAGVASAGINTWTTNGLEGGDVRSLAIDPASPTTLYAGTSGGLVFKSTNGGDSWRSVSAGLSGGLGSGTTVSALAIDPHQPNTIYAARSGFSIHAGIFKSSDGGESWYPSSAGLVNTSVLSLVIDSWTPSVLYAGLALGGVYRSDDSGRSWVFLSLNPAWEEGPDVRAMALDQTALYAGTSEGIFRNYGGTSTNWTTRGLSASSVHALVSRRQGPWDYDQEVLYAGTGAGAFKSYDGGASWTAVNAGLTVPGVLSLALDPSAFTTLYAGTVGGVFKTIDGGVSWRPSSAGLGSLEVAALAIDPSVLTTIYAGTVGGGVFKSADAGVTWTSINRGNLDEPCVSDTTTLCLGGGRFRVTTQWGDWAIGRGSSGQAIALAGGDTGLFTFFGSDNVEVVVKVLNACSANGSFWIFAGGLTDVDVVLTVTDTRTGTVKSYTNPQGTPFRPIQDTTTFTTCGVETTMRAPSHEVAARASRISTTIPEPGAAATGLCVPNATTLCLGNSRYKVQAQRVEWAGYDDFGGVFSDAPALALTRDTGAFWFFGASNIEVVVKILDGCAVNSHHWTFAAGLTNVGLILTVTDTQTGVVRVYTNPQGRPFEPIQDTSAFESCS